MKMKPTRTQSGVAPVTVLTKPFPCPGQCIFCPNDVHPHLESYLADEPGAQRATLNRFDPYAQTWNRLLALHRMGHSVEGQIDRPRGDLRAHTLGRTKSTS